MKENGLRFFIISRMFSMNEYNLLQNAHLREVNHFLEIFGDILRLEIPAYQCRANVICKYKCISVLILNLYAFVCLNTINQSEKTCDSINTIILQSPHTFFSPDRLL